MESRYVSAWESYWAATSDSPGEAIWDADASLSAEPHSALLAPYADTSLPIVDLGCGSGTQTRWFAGRFGRAIGVDLSHAAIEHARRADPQQTAEFQQLNLADTAAVRELHAEVGDANAYMRAVMHQSDPEDRALVAQAVSILVGRRGRAFVTELLSSSKAVLQELAEAPGGPPPKLARVFEHGLKPGQVADETVPELLRAAGLTVLAEGKTELAQTAYRADGSRIALPAQWLVVGRSG